MFLFLFPETRHGGVNNMGATYNNTEQSKWLFESNNKLVYLKSVRVKLPPLVKSNLNFCGALVLFSMCFNGFPNIEVEPQFMTQRHVSIVFVGYCEEPVGAEVDRVSGLSVSLQTQGRIQSDTPCCTPPHQPALHPPALSAAGMCSSTLYRSIYLPLTLYLPTSPHSLSSFMSH